MTIINVIYGASSYAQQVYHFLDKMGIRVSFFCQTYVDKQRYLFDIPVVSFEQLTSLEEGMNFFVAISNNEVSQNIKLHIQSIFFDKATVIICNNFLPDAKLSANQLGGYCTLCNNTVPDFLPGGLEGVSHIKLFKEHHIIGGGYRKHYMCPICGGVDRERWQVWVLSKYTKIFHDSCRVLHFAPEDQLAKYISANPNCDYYSGDIVKGRALHQIDIMDIPYKDRMFDYIIMNHVLEHLDNMRGAMSEVKRVMKPDGKLILSFPICIDQDTVELPNITTDAERLEHYGQEDHVRLFGKDYVEKVSDLGFVVEIYTPKKYCSINEIERYGFIEDDVLMICTVKDVAFN